MKLLPATVWPVWVCLISCLVHGSLALPALGEVEVQTAQGRVLRGKIDSRTDDRLLWVRHEEDRIVLATSVRWSNVVSAQVDGKKVGSGALREHLQQRSSDGPSMFLAAPIDREGPETLAAGVRHASRYASVSSRIASIRVHAHLVNLDRDVEPDGLEVAVVALNTQGVPLPVRGSLYVRLWGQRSKSYGWPLRGEELQRWTQRVRREDFADGAAVYALRFRTVRPEFDFGLRSEAVLNARLSIHGQGNYEASVPVAVRHFNPVRDYLQQYEGSRFFRGELSENVRVENRQLIDIRRGDRSR